MWTHDPEKLSGCLFVAAGCAFLMAAYMGGQLAFFAPAAVFVALGVRRLLKTRST